MSSFDEEDSADLQWLASELSAIRRELTPAGESRALYLALDQGGTSSRAHSPTSRDRQRTAKCAALSSATCSIPLA